MSDQSGELVRVVFAERRAAKQIKTRLEEGGMLCRNFRMTTTSTEDFVVAVPIVEDATYDDKVLLAIDGVRGFGSYRCPYSSAVLGNSIRLRRPGGTNNDERLTLVQEGLLRAISSFLAVNSLSKASDDLDLTRRIRSLTAETCPVKLELFGDDRTVVIPLRAFDPDDATFTSLLEFAKTSYDEFASRHLWRFLAEVYNSNRVVRRGEVDPNSPVRKSGFCILWASNSSAESGPGSSSWITVTEQGVRQSFCLTHVMFSRGNISEKIRFGKLVRADEQVLDLYAGIGYFTLPALMHGKAGHVYCCEWNEDAVEALRFNLEDNGVKDRATVLAGDCRLVFEQTKSMHGQFDRVSLGLLPSSEGGWRTAIRALKHATGGWLHVHGNVPAHEVRQWTMWLCVRLRNFARADQVDGPDWIVVATHVEKVKSFAPKVNHYVADVFAGPLDRFLSSNASNIASVNLSAIENGSAWVINGDGCCELCSNAVAPPSGALSPDGVLHQAWMRGVAC